MVQQVWRSFLEESGLPGADLELEPVLNTPRALPVALAGRINLNPKAAVWGELEAREALRGFIDRNRGLLCGDPKGVPIKLGDLSLVSFINDGKFYRAVFQQHNYLYPIANGYGELNLAISKNGVLLQISSRLIPATNLPSRAAVDEDSIIERLINREFSYTTIAGQTQRYKVAGKQDLSIKSLVVFPKLEGTRMSIHLAYSVEAGRGMTWTVYFDAIDGRELEVKQNFQT